MNVTKMPDHERETQLILTTDLLARTAQRPATPGNLTRVNYLARKVAELTQEAA